ncbi:unnamed protein product [Symbiodinium sp. CCMP2456]|nr:unnamed protein product [Symbiodinium sp. CCMP2456]
MAEVILLRTSSGIWKEHSVLTGAHRIVCCFTSQMPLAILLCRAKKNAASIFKDMVSKQIQYALLAVGDSVQHMSDEFAEHVEAAGSRLPMRSMLVDSCTPDVFKDRVMDAAMDATPYGSFTYLWQYVFFAIKAKPGRDQEVIIVTDGIDNDSDEAFRGTNGFNYMMELLTGLGISIPRMIIYCIGNEDCVKARYQELAMASGGDCFYGKGAKDAFVAHALLTHAERQAKAKAQKQQYAAITSEGDRFSWFLPVPVEPESAQIKPSASCNRGAHGARVCSR